LDYFSVVRNTPIMKYYLLCYLYLVCLFGHANDRVKDYYSGKLTALINQAENLETKEKFSDAISIYNEALQIAVDENLSTDQSFIYNKIANLYRKQKNIHKANIYYRKSIESDMISKHAASSYYSLSHLKRKEQQLDSAFYFLEKSLSIYDKISPSYETYNTYLKATTLYKNDGKYDLAMKYALLAYKGFEKLNNIKKKASACKKIGLIQVTLGNVYVAKKYLNEALQLNISIKDTLEISYCHSHVGDIFKKEKLYEKAIENYNKAIEVQEKLKTKKELGKLFNNLATSYYLKGEYNKAQQTYNKALSLKKETNDTLSYSNTYLELATIFLEKKELKTTKKYLDSSTFYLKEVHNKNVFLRSYDIQSQYYKLIGDYKLALEYKTKYAILYEELFDEELAVRTNKLEDEFDDDQTRGKIIQLSKLIEVQKQSYFIILVFLILITLAGYIYIKQRQKVKIKNYEFDRLKAVFNGQEIIKENISKDLHDIVSTNYDGIRLKILAMAKADNTSAISAEIVNEIKEINQQIRLISHRLSPLGDKIKEATLTEIIIAQLSEFQYYRKIFVKIQMPLPEILDSLKLEAQTNFYGILLEALSNIEKHSQATKIEIQHVIKGSEMLEFNISDNGIGNTKNNNTGIGISNMKQRAYLLGGECNIAHTTSGTKVIVKFPIKINT